MRDCHCRDIRESRVAVATTALSYFREGNYCARWKFHPCEKRANIARNFPLFHVRLTALSPSPEGRDVIYEKDSLWKKKELIYNFHRTCASDEVQVKSISAAKFGPSSLSEFKNPFFNNLIITPTCTSLSYFQTYRSFALQTRCNNYTGRKISLYSCVYKV